MLETSFTLAAVIGGAVLLFQFVMMLFGIGDHDGGDVAGVHHDGDFSGGHDSAAGHHAGGDAAHHATNWFYEIISIRTLSAAATFYGLAGMAAREWGTSQGGSFVVGVVAGAGAMYSVYWLYKQVYKLQHTGTENIRNALGAAAVVYVPIPANRAGAGKVAFKLQNRLVEYLAVTDEVSRLPTGEKVEIVAIVSTDTVRVARVLATAEDRVSNTTPV